MWVRIPPHPPELYKYMIINFVIKGIDMLEFKQFLKESNIHTISKHEDDPDFTQEHNVQNKLFGVNDYIPVKNVQLNESVHEHPTNSKSLVFKHDGESKSDAKGIVVPKHMWEGNPKAKAVGMNQRNEKRAEVYGGEHRPPLGLGQIEKIHKDALEEHFKKPKHEQIAAEKAAIERLHKAGHLDSKDTTDEGEKTDTVKHEHDEQGRTFEAASSKGVAGHAVYTSGHGEHQKHHVLNTCPGQTEGCGGGVDSHGIADTSRGTCFAPKAEQQYVNASIRRACHEQAKHDPAMTKDWILAHTHSLRRHAEAADTNGTYDAKEGKIAEKKKKSERGIAKRFLFRPNVVDETDRSSRHVIKHLNKQREAEGKPAIIANSYGKTNELHDPENNYHVTHSNIGPKVKHGKEISENKKRDKIRVRQTISATESSGEDIKNDEGHKVPPKNSYLVTNMKRGSDRNKEFEKHVTHAKYWSGGREEHELSEKEKNEGAEGHYDGNGKPTTPDKAHYGHVTVHGEDGKARRYDYQKQHILHPRLVDVDGHKIPTDSRFKDNEHLPKERFKTKNGKDAGAILATTPTTSTSDVQHHSNFTHDVSDAHIEHAKHHNGEYEIDNPHEQEKARGKEYAAPSPITIFKKKPK